MRPHGSHVLRTSDAGLGGPVMRLRKSYVFVTSDAGLGGPRS